MAAAGGGGATGGGTGGGEREQAAAVRITSVVTQTARVRSDEFINDFLRGYKTDE
jgi:hypothetical protein